MFCPKCAAQNTDEAKFCRVCGADISLVPQVMTGHLAERLNEADAEGGGRRHRRRGRDKATVENAAQKFFMGIGFIAVALIISTTRTGAHWWYWMLIPGFLFLGGGIGMYLRTREEQKKLQPPAFAPATTSLTGQPRATELPLQRRNTGELLQPPPSVTEATTRHLGVPVEREPKDV